MTCQNCEAGGRRCEGCGAWVRLEDIDGMDGHPRETSDGTAEQCGPVSKCPWCEKVHTARGGPEPEALTLDGLLAVVTEFQAERFGAVLAQADAIEFRTHEACPTGALYALDTTVVDRILEPRFAFLGWVAPPEPEHRTAMVVCHPDHEDVARRVVAEVAKRRAQLRKDGEP